MRPRVRGKNVTAMARQDAETRTNEPARELPIVRSIDDLLELVDTRSDLYIRWSKGPDADEDRRSRDALTGVELPGLSANPLTVEPWWGARSLRVWIARRLYDYHHLGARREKPRAAWVLAGRECARGPDNEPLIDQVEPVASIDPAVVDEAVAVIEGLNEDWGSLARSDAPSTEGSITR
jgi:hypothetical protein